MKTDLNTPKQEQHPLFPSGDWEGFYIYSSGPSAAQHPMHFFLDFKNGTVTGSGSDNVNAFTWQGTYDTKGLTCSMTKTYPSHSVDYSGCVDENGIWGRWAIGPFTGGFHIWPKNATPSIEEEEEESFESKVVRKLEELKTARNQ
ncbi:MAG: hypothetical protein AAFU60_07730 [Bacteroidota bacterium]